MSGDAVGGCPRRAVRARRLAAPARILGALMVAPLLATGCSQILGFEDTSLRPESEDHEAGADGAPDPATDGAVEDRAEPNVDAGEAGLEDDGGVDASLDAGLITVSAPSSVVLRRGVATNAIHVSVTRETAAAVVVVRLTGAPPGVTAQPLLIGTARTEGDLVISVSDGAALGNAELELTAAGGGNLVTVKVSALIAGATGTLDTTFDADGLVADTSAGASSQFLAVVLDGAGGIVAGGRAADPLLPAAGWILRRFSSSGAPDATFGPVLPATGELRALAVDGAGNVIAAGSAPATEGGPEQLTVVRVTAAGVVDATFGGGVVHVLDDATAPLGSRASAVTLDTNGAVVVAGTRSESDGSETGIAVRLGADGAPDDTFNGGAPLAFPSQPLVGVAFDGAGNVVLAGNNRSSGSAFFVTRRSGSGGVDATFGTGGALSFGAGYRARGFARYSDDGSLVLVGSSTLDASLYTAARASAQGTPAWARGVANAATSASFEAVALTPSGSIVAAGSSSGPDGEARVDRLLLDGTRDTSFGSGGTSVLESATPPDGIDVGLHAVAIQADGRIVVVGDKTGAGAVIYRMWP